ncbi:ropporin-1-like protein [Lasioglossum baleicum]|uniref:ropporin-1-like protein n=1 Tax=Lasioglossum baleicum TaxID=434251 RepID=UPI003FCE7F32
MEVLLEKWQGMSMPETSLYQILMVGQLLSKRDCDFFKFLAIACGFLGKNLFETMIYVCELLTEEPEGGSAMILLPTFLRLFAYLAKLDCSGVRPCICIAEDAEEISQPCGPPSVSSQTRTGTSRSSLYQLDEHEQEEVVTAARCSRNS